jgi:SPP1 gp7 family putative phage head morphogenesis protein
LEKAIETIDQAIERIEAMQYIAKGKLSYELGLEKLLRGMFKWLNVRIVAAMIESGRVPSSDLERKRIISSLTDASLVYNKHLLQFATPAMEHGRSQVLAVLQGVGFGVSLTQSSPFFKKILQEHIFQASQRTMDRITGNVMENLAKSYEDGLGIDDAAKKLDEVFTGLQDYESKRIARTEINNAQNFGSYVTMQEYEVEYIMWITAHDERVRKGPKANHRKLHGQITKRGDKFSNGLEHPGDRSAGKPAETINCRCTCIPYFIPEGYMAPPGKRYFYEHELIKVKK